MNFLTKRHIIPFVFLFFAGVLFTSLAYGATITLQGYAEEMARSIHRDTLREGKRDSMIGVEKPFEKPSPSPEPEADEPESEENELV